MLAGTTAILVHNVSYDGACTLPPIKGKTQAQTPNHNTLSGWAGNPEGYTRVPPEKVLSQTGEMDGPITPGGFRDHGVDGQYYASHAERQAALAEPDAPIGVDRPMCDDCIDWFKKYAQHRGAEQRVTDPTGINIFRPNGQWVVHPQ